MLPGESWLWMTISFRRSSRHATGYKPNLGGASLDALQMRSWHCWTGSYRPLERRSSSIRLTIYTRRCADSCSIITLASDLGIGRMSSIFRQPEDEDVAPLGLDPPPPKITREVRPPNSLYPGATITNASLSAFPPWRPLPLPLRHPQEVLVGNFLLL